MKPLPLLLLALAATAQAQTHFAVTVVGKGRPVILIPGLTCGGDVWDATVARLKGRYQCHVLTLAGFAGRPAVPGPFLDPVRDDIIAYVRAKRLDHPAVIGHSLGGFMAFALGAKEPKLFGPLIAVDGVPWLNALTNPGATQKTVRPAADAMAKAVRSATPAQFQAQLLATLKTQITDPKEVERIDASCKKTDPAAMAEAMEEMMVTDLRDEVAKIQSPVLLFAAGGWAKTPAQRTMLEKMYQSQIAKVPHAQLVPAWESRHFVMLDQPTLFMEKVEGFLKENWPER